MLEKMDIRSTLWKWYLLQEDYADIYEWVKSGSIVSKQRQIT